MEEFTPGQEVIKIHGINYDQWAPFIFVEYHPIQERIIVRDKDGDLRVVRADQWSPATKEQVTFVSIKETIDSLRSQIKSLIN